MNIFGADLGEPIREITISLPEKDWPIPQKTEPMPAPEIKPASPEKSPELIPA